MKTALPRSSFMVRFGGPRPRPKPLPKPGVPTVARSLALAYKIDRAIQAGEFRNLADAARALDLSRSRASQIMQLLRLAAEIQEAVLTGQATTPESQLRRIAAEPDWNRQVEMWRQTDE